MPRNSAPHFKVLCSIQNHEKIEGLFEDHDAFAIWVKLGLLAVERYADRTDDRFKITVHDARRITQRSRADHAWNALIRVADLSRIEVDTETISQGYVFVIWRNFAKKQFPRREDGTRREGSASATASASTKEPPKSPPKGDALSDLWERIQAAFTEHGKRGDRMKLTEARRKRLRARLREHDEGELIQAVHGYIATHGKTGDDRFDPMRNFTPDTIFGTKCAKYVEAATAREMEKPRWEQERDHRRMLDAERKAMDRAVSPASRRPSDVPGVTRMSDIPRRRH